MNEDMRVCLEVIVEEILGTLPMDTRKAIRLRFWHDFEPAQVDASMGWRIGTFKGVWIWFIETVPADDLEMLRYFWEQL